MKITTTSNLKLFCAALLVFALNHIASAADATALSLIKEANEYVGKDARDRVPWGLECAIGWKAADPGVAL